MADRRKFTNIEDNEDWLRSLDQTITYVGYIFIEIDNQINYAKKLYELANKGSHYFEDNYYQELIENFQESKQHIIIAEEVIADMGNYNRFAFSELTRLAKKLKYLSSSLSENMYDNVFTLPAFETEISKLKLECIKEIMLDVNEYSIMAIRTPDEKNFDTIFEKSN